MSQIRLTKQFNFETGHALYGCDGKCKNVHGQGPVLIGLGIYIHSEFRWALS